MSRSKKNRRTVMNVAASVAQRSVTELPGGQVIAAGRTLKAAVGTIEISFGTTFAEPPFVVVSPNWPDGVVGSIETIKAVDRSNCQVNSQNAANNYHVSWVAVGRK
jgi:hypothetical protein